MGNHAKPQLNIPTSQKGNEINTLYVQPNNPMCTHNRIARDEIQPRAIKSKIIISNVDNRNAFEYLSRDFLKRFKGNMKSRHIIDYNQGPKIVATIYTYTYIKKHH